MISTFLKKLFDVPKLPKIIVGQEWTEKSPDLKDWVIQTEAVNDKLLITNISVDGLKFKYKFVTLYGKHNVNGAEYCKTISDEFFENHSLTYCPTLCTLDY